QAPATATSGAMSRAGRAGEDHSFRSEATEMVTSGRDANRCSRVDSAVSTWWTSSPELAAAHHGISTTGASHPTTDPIPPSSMVGTCPDSGRAATSAPVAAETKYVLRGGKPGHTVRHPHR